MTMARKKIAISEEGIEYDSQGRLKFNPDFHPRHGEPWTEEELAYLCRFYESDPTKSLSMALGRLERTIEQKMSYLHKSGLIDYYKKKWDRLFERGECNDGS